MKLFVIEVGQAREEIKAGKITQWRCCPHPNSVLKTKKQGGPIDKDKYGYSLVLIRYGKEYLFLSRDEDILHFNNESEAADTVISLGFEPHEP